MLIRCAILSIFVAFFAAQTATAQESYAPMSFRKMTSGGNCDTCYWIAADGRIDDDTADRLREFLEYDGHTPMSGVRIHLNSPGGSLMGGIRLGEAIREMEMNTAVSTSRTKEKWEDGTELADSETDPESQCSSACAFAFIGGINRYASKNTPPEEVGFRRLGRLGVHQFYDPRSLIDPAALSRTGMDAIADQLIVALLLEHVERMGVSSALLQLASKTLPSDMHYLTEAELVSTRADTWSVRDIAIRGYKNGVAIVELAYARKQADYRLELYCDKGKLMMLANVRWRGGYDVDGHKTWHFFDGISFQSPSSTEVRLQKVGEVFSQGGQGGVEGKFRFAFNGIDLREAVSLKHFAFSDWSSRHANDAAKELAFELPDDFEGLYLLPSACLG